MLRRKKKVKLVDPAVKEVRRRRLRSLMATGVILIISTLIVTGAVSGMKYLEQRVTSKAPVTTVRVAFTSRPVWMPRSLAEEIARSLIVPKTEFMEKELTADVYKLARANPWIRKVNAAYRRPTSEERVALIEIDCEFRMPIARVAVGKESAGDYAYVDVEGYRLPAKDVPQWIVGMTSTSSSGQKRLVQVYFRDSDLLPPTSQPKAIHYILICGVQAPPPPIGRQWEGLDILEGLKMVNLILNHAISTYANQIARVDVRNFENRISRREPQIRLVAQIDDGPATDIRFGRFEIPGGGDFEISSEQKLAKLDEFFADNGNKLAGVTSWIDLQYDELHHSPN